MAELIFNGKTQEAMEDYSVVPAGLYNAQVVKTDIVKTKAGTGSLLKAQFKIIDGKFKGRVIFSQYNLANPNQQAVDISMRQIKTLCDAIGIEGFGDTNEIHNIPMQIKVAIKPENPPYPESNEIKFYDKYKGAAEGEAEPAESSSTDTPPWAK